MTRRYPDPFGAPRGTAPRFWPDDKGFVGGVKDSTGLTSIGAREYDPATGRFTSVDPILGLGESQRLNAYAYANNSPATFTDPTGLNFSCMEGIQRCGKDGGVERAAKEERKRLADEAAKRGEQETTIRRSSRRPRTPTSATWDDVASSSVFVSW